MKNTLNILTFMAAICGMALGLSASDGANYFVGQWDVLIEGTPSGDSKMILVIAEQDGSYAGHIDVPEEEGEDIPMESVEIDDKEMTVKFISQGFLVDIWLEKIDENKAEGYLMDSFDTSAVRITAE